MLPKGNLHTNMDLTKADADIADCICEYTAPTAKISEDEEINDFLNMKCFNGKSFVEIEPEVTVDVIY
jgi:hypothetical protein